MTTLVIAEKNSVATDIAKALGGFSRRGSVFERSDILITGAVGHLVELHVPAAAEAPRGFAGLPLLPEQFDLRVLEKTRAQFEVIASLLRRQDVTTVMNACDAGREGELIFRLILEMAECHKPVKRMWCQSMTQDALRSAFNAAKAGSALDNLAAAARCRSEADWLIGINGSRAVMSVRERQSAIRESASAGRVQTPTLALIVDREREIAAFKPRDFWELVGTFGAHAGSYKGKWRGKAPDVTDDAATGEKQAADGAGTRLFDKSAAERLLLECQGQPVEKVDEVVKPATQHPPRLFDLTTLQREANKRFKFPVQKTLDIAQSLYESHKMATYPRTDSSALPEDYVDTARSTMEQLRATPWGGFAAKALDEGMVRFNKRIFDNAKISDHFAIVPTGVLSDQLSDDERRIYELIVRRFIAAFFPAAQFVNTVRTTVVAGHPFLSKGRVLQSAGWLEVLDELGDDGKPLHAGETALCAVRPGEIPLVEGMQLVGGTTTPPLRYSEATLLAAMETAGRLIEDEEQRAAMKEKGLGTPATRAATIEGLLDDGKRSGWPKEPYLLRSKGYLLPTVKANSLIDLLRGCGAGFLASAQTTGEWEHRLALVEKGQLSRAAFMAALRENARHLVHTLEEASESPAAEGTPTLAAPCPACGATVLALPGAFRCGSQCGYEQRREIAARQLSDVEMTRLLNGETLSGLQGFYSTKKKAKFVAGLKRDGQALTFVFDADSAGGTATCTCPRCGKIAYIKPALAHCPSCDLRIWREMCGRKLTDSMLQQLLKTGRIAKVAGFVSPRTNKTFDAGLRLVTETGKLDFVWLDKEKPKRTPQRA